MMCNASTLVTAQAAPGHETLPREFRRPSTVMSIDEEFSTQHLTLDIRLTRPSIYISDLALREMQCSNILSVHMEDSPIGHWPQA